MALSSVPFMIRDGTLTLEDATGAAIVATVTYEDGDFTHDAIEEAYTSTMILKDRGTPYTMRKTETQECSFSFTAHATDFTDATEKTLVDACMKTGAFAAGVSTLGASADVWTLKAKWVGNTASIGGSSVSISMLKCRCSVAFSEGNPGKFAIKGTIFISAVTDFVIA